MKTDSFDSIFQALAHPARRRMLDIVKDTPGCNVNDVAAAFEMTRIGVMKHLAKLEEAGLIHSEKSGRDRRLYFNIVPIQLIYDRWTMEYSGWWAGRMVDIKYAIEAGTNPQEPDA
ncbi:MAG: metalloregulator ArsR/SmtB family transcription factor [Acidobacteria bacterium]|nr:metalloregulator ArsR/SmtB family transcription factor [Acidobacteriota bacterium]